MTSYRKIRRAARRPFETSLFTLAAWLIPLMPRFVVIRLARLLALLTYALARRERTIGMTNLDRVFGSTKTAREKRDILKRSVGSFALMVMDLFWFSRNTRDRVKRLQTFCPATGPFFEKRAQILITAHTGNWELIGIEAGLLDIDLASIAAVTRNAAIEKQLNALRQRTGQTVIPRKGAMRTLVSRLRAKWTVAFVLDQNTSEAEGGVWVDFLGIPTPISPAPAFLAYRTGTDIVFAFSQPAGNGAYSVHNGHVIRPPTYSKSQDHDRIVRDLTQQIVNVIGRQILEHPDSWLWTYKYWRRRAPGSDPAIYPTYDA